MTRLPRPVPPTTETFAPFGQAIAAGDDAPAVRAVLLAASETR